MTSEWRYDRVGCIPPLCSPDPARPCHIYCSKDGKRILYGCPTGVVVRCLPDQYDGGFQPVEIMLGSKRPIRVATCSPDDSYIAGGDDDGNVCVWSKEKSGTKLMTYRSDMQYVKMTDLSFSEDSRRLALCGMDKYNKKLAACIVASAGNAAGKIEGHTVGVNAISFRQQKPHRIATVGVDGLLGIHEGPPFKLLKSSEPHEGQVFCCRYSPDGGSLVTCGETGDLFFWHPTTGKFDRRVHLSDSPLYSLAWSPNSTRIAIVSADYKLRIYDVHEDSVVAAVSFDEDSDCQDGSILPVGVCWAINAWVCVLMAEGRIVGFAIDERQPSSTNTAAGTTTVVSKCRARLAFQWTGVQGLPTVLELNHMTGGLVCGSHTGSLMFLMREKYPRGFQTFHLPGGVIKSILLGRDSGFAVSADCNLRHFRLTDVAHTSKPPPPSRKGTAQPATAADARRQPKKPLTGGTDSGGAVDKSFVQNFSLLSEGAVPPGAKPHKPLTSWEVAGAHRFEGNALRIVPLHNEESAAVICTSGAVYAYPWKVKRESFAPSWTLQLPVAAVTAAAYTPDGTIIALGVVAGPDYPIESRCVGRLLEECAKTPIAGRHLLEIYECEDPATANGFKHIWTFDWHTDEITAVGISFDGIHVASADRKRNIVVSDLRDGERVISNEWDYHLSTITALEWSPDGTKLASGSLDRVIYVRDIERPSKYLCIKDAHHGEINSLKYLQNNVIASIGSDGTLQVFEILYD